MILVLRVKISCCDADEFQVYWTCLQSPFAAALLRMLLDSDNGGRLRLGALTALNLAHGAWLCVLQTACWIGENRSIWVVLSCGLVQSSPDQFDLHHSLSLRSARQSVIVFVEIQGPVV